jgi:type II secretory pathway pseudopilin PulG
MPVSIKGTMTKFGGTHGFTLMQTLIAIAVVFAVTGIVFAVQLSPWNKIATASSVHIAGTHIKAQIEKMRSDIALNPKMHWPPVNGAIEKDKIKISWTISTAIRPKDGAPLSNVKRCDVIAVWGTKTGDTLAVSTYLAKAF